MRGHFDYASFEFPPHFGPWGRGSGFCGRGRYPFGMMGWPVHRRPGCRPHGPPGFNDRPNLFGMPLPPWTPCAPPPACPLPPPHEDHQTGHDERHRLANDECNDRPEGGSLESSDGQHQSTSGECHGPPNDHGPRRSCRTSGRPRGPEDCNESSGHLQDQGCERREPAEGCKRRGPPGLPGDCHGSPECDHHGRRDNEYDCYGRGYEHHVDRRFGPHFYNHSCGNGRGWSNHSDWWSFGFGPHFGRRHGYHHRVSPYNRPGECLGRDRAECRSGRRCSKNKENQVSNRNKCGEREGDHCERKNKERKQTENTVLIQRIVVESAPTQSV